MGWIDVTKEKKRIESLSLSYRITQSDKDAVKAIYARLGTGDGKSGHATRRDFTKVYWPPEYQRPAER